MSFLIPTPASLREAEDAIFLHGMAIHSPWFACRVVAADDTTAPPGPRPFDGLWDTARQVAAGLGLMPREN